MRLRHAFAPALAALGIASGAHAQPAPADLGAQFVDICGKGGEAGPALPGSDIAAAEAPAFFASDLHRATESRVVKTGDGYAMRGLIPSDFDPQHALLLKCAVAAKAAFPAVVDRLAALIPDKPRLSKTDQGLDLAMFSSGASSFAVFSEAGGWVSVYKMEILMRNVDPKYLKKGAKPAPVPSVR